MAVFCGGVPKERLAFTVSARTYVRACPGCGGVGEGVVEKGFTCFADERSR